MARSLSDLLAGVIGILTATTGLAVPALAQLTDLPAEATEVRISAFDAEGGVHSLVGRIGRRSGGDPGGSRASNRLRARIRHLDGHRMCDCMESPCFGGTGAGNTRGQRNPIPSVSTVP